MDLIISPLVAIHHTPRLGLSTPPPRAGLMQPARQDRVPTLTRKGANAFWVSALAATAFSSIGAMLGYHAGSFQQDVTFNPHDTDTPIPARVTAHSPRDVSISWRPPSSSDNTQIRMLDGSIRQVTITTDAPSNTHHSPARQKHQCLYYDSTGRLTQVVNELSQGHTFHMGGTSWDKNGELLSWASIGLEQAPDWQSIDIHDFQKTPEAFIQIPYDNFVVHHYSPEAKNAYETSLNTTRNAPWPKRMEIEYITTVNKKQYDRPKNLREFIAPVFSAKGFHTTRDVERAYPTLLHHAQEALHGLKMVKNRNTVLGALAGLSIFGSVQTLRHIINRAIKTHQEHVQQQKQR